MHTTRRRWPSLQEDKGDRERERERRGGSGEGPYKTPGAQAMLYPVTRSFLSQAQETPKLSQPCLSACTHSLTHLSLLKDENGCTKNE